MPDHFVRRSIPACILVLFSLVTGAVRADEAAIRFNRDIRPILSDNCFLCHGPDKNQRKGKLRLDDREVAVAKKAIVPGKAAESELVKRIFTADEDDLMPPPDSHRKLSAKQKELLKKWIEQGAVYEPHWAYMPVERPEVPGKAANPIDGFIWKKLAIKGITPSAEADRRTLLRRLSLDLIGIPPTPSEVEAFVNDKSADAFEKQVDRLLASPHFGERMAAAWLDLARFTDTVGYHGDQNQRIFPYRDWVIEAYNRNKKFDQFAIEQLAGDLLPNPTVEQRVATGFNRLNMMTREGGAQPKEYLAKYQGDRVRTVSAAFLGSTMACCECHDHKYDPFSAKDFYAMSAFFADVKQWGVYHDYAYTPNPDLRPWSNDHPWPPEIQVESPYLKSREAKLRTKIGAIAEESLAKAEKSAAFGEWKKNVTAFVGQHRDGWLTPVPSPVMPKTAAKDKEVVVNEDRTILVTGPVKKGDATEVLLTPPPGYVAAIKLELVPNAKLKGSSLRSARTTAISVTVSHKSKAGKDAKVAVYHADADKKEARYANGFEIIGVKDSWKTPAKDDKSVQTAVYLLDKPVKLLEGEKIAVTIKSDHVGCVRLSVSPFVSEDFFAKTIAPKLDDRAQLAKAYLTGTAQDADAFATYKTLYREITECRDGKTWTMVTEAWAPKQTRVLPRGNWQDESGEIVKPAVPHFLPQLATSNQQPATRLDLAKWLVSKDSPLTARTQVNRLWKQFFGNGLSAVVDDLGAQGEPPSHPELLEWLAAEYQSDWDTKRLIKLMVMSATYRQRSNLRPELRDIDPNNRLLASQNPRRLDAEFVRDNALFISGLLVTDLGGPSVHPYQPAGYYVNIQFPNRDYHPETDERQYRRGVYMHWQRTFLHPMLANFDAPSREECTAYRLPSNTPQQALTLLNDPTFVEASRVFAARVMGEVKEDVARLEKAFELALARPIKAREKESLLKFLKTQREYFGANVEDAKKVTAAGFAPPAKELDVSEHAAWATVCRVILNLHETITRY